MSNGRYAMRLISSYIRKMPANISFAISSVAGSPPISSVATDIRYCHSLSPKAVSSASREHPEERLTASAIVYSRVRREVWMIGDCQCLANGQHYDNPKPYEQRLAEMRAHRANQLLAEGNTVEQLLQGDPAREVIIAPLIETMRQQNVTFAVIDGFPIAEQARARLHPRLPVLGARLCF